MAFLHLSVLFLLLSIITCIFVSPILVVATSPNTIYGLYANTTRIATRSIITSDGVPTFVYIFTSIDEREG